MSAAGNYKNYTYLTLSQAEVDALDANLPVTEPVKVSKILDAALEAQKVRTVLSAKQLRTLNATPVQILPAPGAGLALIIEKVVAKMTYGSYAYDSVGAGEDLAFKYTNASGAVLCQLETTGFLDQTSNQIRVGFPNNGTVASVNLTPVANAPIVAHILSGEIAAADADANGDSPIQLDVYYSIIAV